MKNRMFRIACLLPIAFVAVLASFAGQAQAATGWSDLTTISNTMGLTVNKVCIGGDDGDIGCPTYAPSVANNGTLTATAFVGDGSGLTGVVASTGDRIVSGTTSMIAYTSSGLISITQSGVNTAYFHPSLGLVTIGVSSTGTISTTNLRSGKITAGDISAELTSGYGSLIIKQPVNDKSNGLAIVMSGSGNPASGRIFVDDNQTLQITRATASETLAFTTSGLMGVGTSFPKTTLHVSGTLKIADSGESCDTNRQGAIRYNSGEFYVCRNGTAWESLSSIAAGGATVADGLSGSLVFRDGTGALHGHPTISVSSSTGSVGIGTTSPNAKLDVYGTISATSSYINSMTTTQVTLLSNGYANGSSLNSYNLSLYSQSSAPNISLRHAGVSGLTPSYDYLGYVNFWGANSSYTAKNLASIAGKLDGASSDSSLPARLIFSTTASGSTAMTERATLNSSGYFGIGTASPSAALHVVGTAIVADGGEACDTNRQGAIRYNSGEFYVCRNGTAWESLTSIAAGATAAADRITSGTTYVVADGTTGLVSITQSGTNTAYFHPQLGLVTVGVSSTGPISATYGYFNSYVSIFGAGGLNVANNISGARFLSWQGSPGTAYSPAFSQLNNASGMYFPASNTVAFSVSGSEAVRIASNGYVGIGTSTPYANLHIVRTGTAVSPTIGGNALIIQAAGTASGGPNFDLIGGNAGQINIMFGDTDQTDMGKISYNHIDDSMRFYVTNAEAMHLVSNGWIGIGTTDPSAAIHVTRSGGIKLGASGASNPPLSFVDSTGVNYSVRPSGSALVFTHNAYSPYQFIFAGQNASTSLGINTLGTPSATLHVSGTLRLADGGEACDANRQGAIRYNSGEFYVCRNGTAWESLTAIGGSVASETLALNDLSDVSTSVSAGNIFAGTVTGAVNTATNTTGFGIGALSAGGNTGWSNSAFGNASLKNNTTGSWNSAFGRTSLYSNTAGTSNNAFGVNALYNNTGGSTNSAFGGNALYGNTSGGNNVAMGANTLMSNTTGMGNVAVGVYALSSALAENYNTAIGMYSVQYLASGYNNMIAGASAGKYMGTGSRNSFLGANALAYGDAVTDTVAIGYFAGYGVASTTTANQSVLLGAYAGQGITASTRNILIGYNAGGAITTGGDNIVIGSNISPYSNTGSYQLNLGNALFGDLGGASNLKAKLGINVTSPTTNFDVSGTSYFNGNVGIGTSNPSKALQVSGSFQVSVQNGSFSSLELIPFTTAVGADIRSNGSLGVFANTTNRKIAITTSSGTIIGDYLPSANTPSTTLQVSGTIRLSDSGETCDANRTGAIRYNSGEFYVCRNGTAWESLTSIASGATLAADRITSGTTYVVADGTTGLVSITQSGTNTAYFHPALGLVTIGVSSTGGISGTTGYFTGSVSSLGNFQLTSGKGLLWSGSYNDAITGDGTSHYLSFTASGTQAMRIVSTGYIGVNTSTPYGNIHIVRTGTAVSPTTGGNGLIVQNTGTSNGWANLALIGGNAGMSNLYFGDTDQTDSGRIAYDHAGDSMRFAVPSGEAMRIVSTGYVGLGTSSPKVKLDIAGNSIKLGGEGQFIGFNGYYDNTLGSWMQSSAGAHTAYIRIGMQSAGEGGDIQIGTDSLDPNTTSDTSSPMTRRLVIRRAGDVRIASSAYIGSVTVTPTAMLEVAGNISATGLSINGQPVSGGSADLFTLTHVSASTAGGNLLAGNTQGATVGITNTTAFGIGVLGSASNTGYGNTIFGSWGLNKNTTGYYNTGVGSYALFANTTGIYNTATGYYALAGNTTGNYNTAYGGSVLVNNTTGNTNVGMGIQALAANTSGGSNVAVGGWSMMVNTTGAMNVGVGANTLRWNTMSGNVAVGNSAMQFSEQASNTVAIGASAGLGVASTTTVQNGTFVGTQSGYGITTGNSNTMIGFRSGFNVSSGSNNITLGAGTNLLDGTASNQLNIGNAIYGDLALNRIGLGGITSPTVSLEVSGTISSTLASANVGNFGNVYASGMVSTAALYVNGQPISGGAGDLYTLSHVSASTPGSNLFIGDTGGAIAGVTGTTVVGLGALGGGSNSGNANTAVGRSALNKNTTGFNNTAMGLNSAYNNTTGMYNTTYGYSTLYTNTTGYNNTAVGYAALNNNTTGYYQTAIGGEALNKLFIGSNNTAVGLASGKFIEIGSRNTLMGVNVFRLGYAVTDTVAIGYFAGYGVASTTTADRSVMVGTNAGMSIVSSSNNILIGYNAASGLTTGNNNIVIGSGASPYSNAGDNQLNIGNVLYGDLALNRIGLGGITSPTVSLEVSGTISSTLSTANIGNFGNVYASGMVSTAALYVNGQPISGGASDLYTLAHVSVSTTAVNLFVGSVNGSIQAGGYNAVLGMDALSNASNQAYESVAVGGASLRDNTTGYANTAVGAFSLSSNTTGRWNTALGDRALQLNLGGNYNTAIGGKALQSNTTGSYNIATGVFALSGLTTGSYNIATGYESIFANQTGESNVAMGFRTLKYANPVTDTVAIGANAGRGPGGTTSANQSVLIGSGAGMGLTSSTNNIFIGYNSGNTVTTGGNNILIGTSVAPLSNTGSNQLNIGNAIYGDLALQRIGLGGITSPTASLDVSGTVKASSMATGGLAVTGASSMSNVSVTNNLSVAGSVDMNGGLTVTGAVTATTFYGAFVGDGSGLTNLSISGDSITSGTTKVTANTNGYISLTTGGTTTGYFNTAGQLIVPGISSTGVISGTNAYFTNQIRSVGYAFFPSVFLTDGLGLAWGNANTNIAGNSAASYLRFIVSNTDVMRIVSNGNVGIGTSSPNAKLEVDGTISSTVAQAYTGTFGNVYASGMVSTAALYVNGQAISGGAGDLYTLAHVSASIPGNNLFAGSLGGANAGVNNTTSFGVGSLGSTNNAGQFNTAFGATSLYSNTSGVNNTANGVGSLYNNTVGANNTGTGAWALFGNTQGTDNTGMGVNVLNYNTVGAANTAVGSKALYYANLVYNTVAVGAQSGYGVSGTTSFQNGTLLGYQSGFGITTGNSNTLIGFRAGSNVTTGSNNIALGASTGLLDATASNQLNIGNAIYGDIAMKRIGIGVTSPSVALEVNGTISATSIQSTGTMRLGKYSSQPVACAAGYDGYIALTSQYTTCVCNGGTSTWVKTSDGSTACTW